MFFRKLSNNVLKNRIAQLENIMNRLNQANIRNIMKARKIEANECESDSF